MTTVLYIEDLHDNMRLVQRVVIADGYGFLYATNGLSGLRLAEEHQPALILLDINLPDIDGYEVVRRLRRSPLTKHIPVVALTANAMRGDDEKCLKAGCDAYMSKPINIDELSRRIRAFALAVA